MSYLKYILRAVRLEANINRVYEIYLDKGLFDSWVVTIGYGRYGKGKGIIVNYSFRTLQEANSFINKTLKKRYNSHNRIGCCYEAVK